MGVIFSRSVGLDGDRSATFTIRLAVAVVQAVALYLLTDSAVQPTQWPATDLEVYAPLRFVFQYIPILVLFGLGQISARPLVVWVTLATLIIAVLGYHDAARGRFIANYIGEGHFAPWPPVWLGLATVLFVANVLVVDSIIQRRLFPPYTVHFDTAWKQGIQVVLSAIFVGIFWGVLLLGAGLFKLVDIDFLSRLIHHLWFSYPATTLAIAASIHITDVQASLTRGVRTLALTLFSWLLPVLAPILAAFLAVLPFISIDALWKTRHATALLLVAAGLLVFFINGCYQDGAAEGSRSRIKRVAAVIASIELVPLAGLAVWALGLRVQEYGWSVERIFGAAAILLAACYALGYAGATVFGPKWMKRLEVTNFVAAYLFLAEFLALFSPLADPARLMVADQMARLKSGAITPDRFDFQALKFDGARWGTAALKELSESTDESDGSMIKSKALNALAAPFRNYNAPATSSLGAPDVAERIAVYPSGRALPTSFLDFKSGPLSVPPWPSCLNKNFSKCIARFVSLQPGRAEAILFFDNYVASIYEQDQSGTWRRTATLFGAGCAGFREQVESGNLQLEPHQWPDIVVGQRHLSFSSTVAGAC